MKKPLEDLRVLDLSHTLAGPFASVILADLGAEVIKVESLSGDETRQWAPFIDNTSVYYLSINRGKKSIAIDLKTSEGKNIVYKLVEKSHIVLENYRPGVREKLGVDPDKLFSINKNLVYVSIKGFKPGSLYEEHPAYDIVIQGLSGLMLSTGFENQPPVRVPFALFDVFTGMMAVIYALTGLYSSLKPYYAEVYLYDTAIFSMCYLPLIYLLTGRKPRRMGHAHPSIVPYQAFRDSENKWFIVAAANDRFFQKLCEVIGKPELANDPRFSTNPDRVKNRDELIGILEKVFIEKPREYWLKILSENQIPASLVYEIDEVFQDPYVVNEIMYEINHPKLGFIKQLTQPGRVNNERLCSKQHQPELGEHTVEILREIGFSDSEVEELIKRNIVKAINK